MSVTETELRRKQIEQAEELLFSGPPKAGFANDLFFGRFRAESILPYPALPAELEATTRASVEEVARFAREHIDAARIDRESLIPDDVIQGLGRIGVLGMCVSPKYGGRGFSQQQYCRIMEVIGAHCGSTTVFVNAHHSIGLRSLELFGTQEQKERWLPRLASGQILAAFALTEPEAGSDASNVRTRATPTPDGRGYVLNGTKRYITNGGIAGVLTVMARTPDPKNPDGKVTAFLVTPDMPGFEVLEARMDKVGIRGTATARLAFHDLFVPKENILGEFGKGLRLALTVLDFGRTTFGASCTGAAKFCVQEAVRYANERRQFGKTLGEFELVREKIALAAAETYAMEAATYHTAAVIDSGAEDYMLETSMIKLFASDSLWRIVNDTLQIHGGAGFFTDRPFERMMRDARLNLIGEGANDVLRCFNAMVGLRNLGKDMQEILKKPWRALTLWRTAPRIPVAHGVLQPSAHALSKQIARFSRACVRALVRYREDILDHEFVQARLGDTATELFHASCVYSRLDSLMADRRVDEATRQRDLQTGLCYLRIAFRRNTERLAALHHNEDDDLNETAILAGNETAMTQFDTAFQFAASNIRFGTQITHEVGSDLVDLGARRVLVLMDAALRDTATGKTVLDSLRKARVDFDVYDRVVVEPTDASFREAAAAARRGPFDAFVAVGGGSTIDTAKAANLYSTFDADFFDFVNAPIGKGLPVPGPIKPLVAIPTTAGTGSETTGVAIFDDLSRHAKTGIAHRYLKPTLGIVDSENTRTLPPAVAASSGLDVLSHALESYTAIPYTSRPRPARPLERPAYQGANPVSDVWALRALELVAEYLPRAVSDSSDDEARGQMHMASAIAGMGFGNAGVHLPHGMSYPVSGKVQDFRAPGYRVDKPLIPHGMSVILHTPAVVRFTASSNPGRHLRAAAALGADISDAAAKDAGDVLAARVIEVMRQVGMPNGLKAVGYTEAHIPELVQGTLPQHRVTKLSPRPAGEKELAELFRASMTIW